MERRQLKVSFISLAMFLTLLLGTLSTASRTMAEEVIIFPPQDIGEISLPCLGMSTVSDTVYFEGDRWLQVCTDGSQLNGFILNYGDGSYSQLFSLEADEGFYFREPRAAVMSAGGIVVLWNQTTDAYQISADSPIYMILLDYDGNQIEPRRAILAEGQK